MVVHPLLFSRWRTGRFAQSQHAHSVVIGRVPAGHPNWGKPQEAVAVNVPSTSFEEIVRKRRLRRNDYLRSQELKEWVRKNKDRKYVPLDLLEAWNFEAEGE